MIKCTIFDLGKVIIFFDNFIFLKKLEKYCSFSAMDIHKKVLVNQKLLRSFDLGEINSGEFYRAAVKVVNARNIDCETFFTFYNDVFSLNPPVYQILMDLKTKCRLVLLSNTDVERFGFIKKKFPEILVFDEYVLSYEEGFIKPQPQIYGIALEKANANADECVFIDDRKENIEAAKKFGINTILFDPQKDLRSEFGKLGLII